MDNWRRYGTVRLRDVNKVLDPLDDTGVRSYCLDRVQNMLALNVPPEARRTLERILAMNKPEDYARWLIGCVVAGELLSGIKERGSQIANVPEPTDNPDDVARWLADVIAAEPLSEAEDSEEKDDPENFDRIKSRLATLPETPWILGDN